MVLLLRQKQDRVGGVATGQAIQTLSTGREVNSIKQVWSLPRQTPPTPLPNPPRSLLAKRRLRSVFLSYPYRKQHRRDFCRRRIRMRTVSTGSVRYTGHRRFDQRCADDHRRKSCAVGDVDLEAAAGLPGKFLKSRPEETGRNATPKPNLSNSAVHR